MSGRENFFDDIVDLSRNRGREADAWILEFINFKVAGLCPQKRDSYFKVHSCAGPTNYYLALDSRFETRDTFHIVGIAVAAEAALIKVRRKKRGGGIQFPREQSRQV